MIILYLHEGKRVLSIPGWMTGAAVPVGARVLRVFPHYMYYRSWRAFSAAFPRELCVDELYAFSMGGQVAYHLLCSSALRARNITFSSAPCVMPRRIRSAPDVTAFAEQANKRPARALRVFQKQCMAGHGDASAILTVPAHMARVFPRYWFRRLYHFSPKDVLRSAHLHIIHGENDGVIPKEQVALWRRICSRARVTIASDTGHMPHAQ